MLLRGIQRSRAVGEALSIMLVLPVQFAVVQTTRSPMQLLFTSCIKFNILNVTGLASLGCASLMNVA